MAKWEIEYVKNGEAKTVTVDLESEPTIEEAELTICEALRKSGDLQVESMPRGTDDRKGLARSGVDVNSIQIAAAVDS